MEYYKKRIADKILERRLQGIGAVLIEGPKWCGKTTTAEQVAKSALYMSDPAELSYNMLTADTNPQKLLAGDTPRLIDEWQIAPKMWDAARFEVDHRGETGQFIFTGSSVPASMDSVMHSGTGRFSRLKMRPMSLFESGESNGSISLKDLFSAPEQVDAENVLDLEEVAFLICRGGWPSASFLTGEIALDQAYNYYDAVVNEDVSRVDGVRRNSERVSRLMRSYARNQGSQTSNEKLLEDIRTNDAASLSPDTVLSYVNALKKIFVIEDIPAWNPNLRSKTVIRSSETRYFTDSSIGTAALGLGPGDLTTDLETCGLFFETLCMRDLRVYADALGGAVYHYRDKNDLECDAVIHLRNGSYGLIEIKLGGEKAIEYGAKTLKTLQKKIDTTKMKQPSFLMVLCAVGNHAYRRPDGVYVVPIGCLKD